MQCSRIYIRMECPECGYPYCEALLPLDPAMPHIFSDSKEELETVATEYELGRQARNLEWLEKQRKDY